MEENLSLVQAIERLMQNDNLTVKDLRFLEGLNAHPNCNRWDISLSDVKKVIDLDTHFYGKTYRRGDNSPLEFGGQKFP